MNKVLESTLDGVGATVQNIVGTSADDYVKGLSGTIIAGGVEGSITGRQLLGAQVISMVLFPIIWLSILSQVPFVAFIFEGTKQVFFYIAFIALGFFFPTMNIGDKKARRQEAIVSGLPDMTDLLCISVEAGLDFMTALRRVVEKQKEGPLRQELDRFFRQMELGRTRREALKELGDRVQLDDLSNMCSALIQADRLGSSIGPVLRMQSDMLRTRRMQRAEKKAMEAPIKMMAPLLACIFPAVFIVMFAPLFIQMAQNMAAR